jgi:hypothetical protein
MIYPLPLYSKKFFSMEQRNLYVDEDLQWLQKSRERWLLQGDQNTNPFHRLANEWKK